MQRFFAELVKKNGENYEPESLNVMIAALDRHINLLKDKEFVGCRRVLNGKAGKGEETQEAGTGQIAKVQWIEVRAQRRLHEVV